MQEILVIGGTGAQGLPVVHALSASKHYSVRVLTRDTTSKRAQQLAQLPNVTLIQGAQDNQSDLHRAFHGVYGAWVNTDGFTLGEKNELFYGFRAYEIARAEGVQHYVYACTDYALKDANWDETYHWGHNDAKGRVGQFILAMGQQGMKSSLITTGPYMEMLWDGMFVPREENGVFTWKNPATLQDVGNYSLWLFENVSESAGLDLKVTTDEVSFADIASTFSKVTGNKGVHQYVPLETYLPLAEPYPNAPANFALGPNAPRDEASMTWRGNFTAWWKFWGEGKAVKRDMEFLDRILPGRIKGLEEWMRKYEYDGRRKDVLKGAEDLRRGVQEMQENGGAK
ncbi:putative NmrA-like family domain-containing protein 1 [Glarea lozoyensis 74030]|uniref:Putative NmrA-like family domain-containing protein 1 n=1 Tax=Glarea lozoyensis (strain ATCC 74030 / MF5533) TaxID=1104152 RepID=H0EPZ6_GLAL7|nr:putative NmrA-like family domain-containing protein 1 [Glarea lozoyensis 74030]